MEKLYRDFVLIALLFLAVTLIINFAPILRCKVEEKPTKVKYIPCEKHVDSIPKQPKQRKIRSFAKTVWDTNSGDDRIVKQMEYKPKLADKDRKFIIAITGSGDFNEPLGDKKFVDEKCSFQNCELVRGGDRDREYDARIFNTIINHHEIHMYPRNPDQVWILYILEGPLASPDYFLMDDVFNWTATYRWDSTIVAPYEKWVPFNNNTKPIFKNFAKGKKKKCAIFVSNCETTNKRMHYVKELQKHIEVDIYGGCGTKVCDRSDENKCFNMLKSDYKFYLAFENSNCKDYITEKFFRNGLMYDTLPVVMGAHPDEYARAAPPNSFLHVENFTSPGHLAKYLHKMDKDDNLYNQYFKWKGTGSFINTKFWCRLCALLNDPQKPHSTIQHLHSWWRPPGVCIRGDQTWTNK